MLHQRLIEETNSYLCNINYVINQNKWKNNFHIEAPFGLINDPNGLCYFNGEFHVFFQWNPNGCEHKTKHWGLVTTTDFINYTEPRIVLRPEDWFDKNGCYSGTALVKEDELWLYYTGNVKNKNKIREPHQCLAIYYDKKSRIKKHGVIIDKQPEGYTDNFRDPFIFNHKNEHFMFVGGQNNDLKGKILVYNTLNFIDWTFLGELKTKVEPTGYMWECPNIVKLNKNKHALIFSPQGLISEEFKNQNLYQSGYIIGEFDSKNLEFKNHTKFKELDMGMDFYAPQVFIHDNKLIMIGWIGMPEKGKDYPTVDVGRIFALSNPRMIEYKSGKLIQKPLDQLTNLRNRKIIDLENINFKKYSKIFDKRCLEVIVELNVSECNILDFKFEFENEYILINYDKSNEVLKIDRTNMELGGKELRKFKLKVDTNLKMHIFIDETIMEIFYQDGLEVTTFMYFPKTDGIKVNITTDKSIFLINKMEIWKLSK